MIGLGCFATERINSGTKLLAFNTSGEWIDESEATHRIESGMGRYILHATNQIRYDLQECRQLCMMSMANSPRGLRYKSGRRKGQRPKKNARLVYDQTHRVFYLVATAVIEGKDEIFWDYGADYNLVAASSTNSVEPPTVIDLVTPPREADVMEEQEGWAVCSGEELPATDYGWYDASWFPGLFDPNDPSSDRPPEYQYDEWHGFSYMQIMSGEAFDSV